MDFGKKRKNCLTIAKKISNIMGTCEEGKSTRQGRPKRAAKRWKRGGGRRGNMAPEHAGASTFSPRRAAPISAAMKAHERRSLLGETSLWGPKRGFPQPPFRESHKGMGSCVNQGGTAYIYAPASKSIGAGVFHTYRINRNKPEGFVPRHQPTPKDPGSTRQPQVEGVR